MQWSNGFLQILVFFLSSKYSADSFSINVNYPRLITNVHEYLATSSVFIVRSEQESLRELERIKGLRIHLSAQNVLSNTVPFRRLPDIMNFDSNRVDRRLTVVSLRSREVVAEFSKVTNNLEMSSSCWLLIFEDDVYLENYLPESDGNMFNLRFDTEMLVVRTGRSTIQEWYWLQNRVKMEDLAVWNSDSGFTPRTNESLYRRRNDLENTMISVTTLDDPLLVGSVNSTFRGLCDVIIAVLSNKVNFSVRIVIPREKLCGSWNVEEERWTGMMEVLVAGSASIAVSEYAMTTSRLEAVDFSLPFLTLSDKLYIRRPERGIAWSAYWKAFSPGIWIIVQVLILSSTILLTLISTVGRSRITPDAISGCFLRVFGIYCQQGLPEFPIDSPSRIAYFSLYLSAMIVSAAYSAVLISFLTVASKELPFSNFEEFVQDGTYNLIVNRDSSDYEMFETSKDPLMIEMWNMMNERTTLPTSVEEGFAQICTQRVALFSPPYPDTFELKPPCEIVEIDMRHIRSFAMPLSKHNPYRGLFNYYLGRLRDIGILGDMKKVFKFGRNLETSVHSETTAWGIIPLVAILAGGVLLAIFILLLERFVFIRRSRGSIGRKIRPSEAARRIDRNILNVIHRGHRTRHVQRAVYYLP